MESAVIAGPLRNSCYLECTCRSPSPEPERFYWEEKGKSVLYLRVKKALYGMMKSALLFYLKLVSELREMGFEINPYDPCVANKMVNGTQMTIRWHVDDLMISHLSQDKIMKVVQGMKDIYGENLTETVRTVHGLLGNDV